MSVQGPPFPSSPVTDEWPAKGNEGLQTPHPSSWRFLLPPLGA